MPDEVETPLVIGARNPFAIAEHKKGEKIEWHKMEPEQKRRKLADALDMPYEKLFDPKNESPLFVKTGDMRPCAPVSSPKWAPNPAGSNYTVTSRLFKDPVQGDLPDCFFIGALTSVAFSEPILIPDKPRLPYYYTFYKPPASEGLAPIADPQFSITNLLPLDSNNIYHYSKSLTAGEIWIAMYEKAFASWVGNKSDTPDYSKICTGDPILALMNLTGRKFTTYKPLPGTNPVTSTASRYSTVNFTNASDIYNKINSACKNAGPYRITAKPMVAYTYDPRIQTPPAGITYTDATIVGNHTYSVLGVLSPDYIVMRNPWGQTDPNPTGLPPGALASGAWYQNTNLATSNDAIFGLKASVFKDYFKGFGWVYP
jgi:hypothetical protein